MNNILKQNTQNVIVFKIQVIYSNSENLKVAVDELQVCNFTMLKLTQTFKLVNNIFNENTLNPKDFKLYVILLIMQGKSQKVAITHLVIGIDSQLTHHVEAMEKVAEQHISTKCSK